MITQNYLTISPAYGRDYKKASDATKDFVEGKDFIMESLMAGGWTYCSVRDFAPGVVVSVRYAKMRKVVNVKVPLVPSAKATSTPQPASATQSESNTRP